MFTLDRMDAIAQYKATFDVRGFVGTVADMVAALDAHWAEEAQAEAAWEARIEAAYESHWPGADQYRAEEEADRARKAWLTFA